MRTTLGKIYRYEIKRPGMRDKNTIVVKVMTVGRKSGMRGINKKHVLVKIIESAEKPFWVREESLSKVALF